MPTRGKNNINSGYHELFLKYTTVLSVLLRYTDFDYPFDIFTFFILLPYKTIQESDEMFYFKQQYN